MLYIVELLRWSKVSKGVHVFNSKLTLVRTHTSCANVCIFEVRGNVWKYQKGSYYRNILGRVFKYKIKIGHRSNTPPPPPPRDYMYLITHQ